MSVRKHLPDWRKARRLQAWELKQKGWRASDIAEALGVTRGAVSQWFKATEAAGLEAFHNQPKSGPFPRLTEEQLNKLPELLAKGVETYGFSGGVWTRRRVASVIQKEFGVLFTQQHIGNLLRQVGWERSKR